MTRRTRDVLAALIQAGPGTPIYGLQIMATTGIQSGTLYPILDRLSQQGWIEGHWEEVNADRPNKPRRRFYTLTGHGARCAENALARHAAKSGLLRPAGGAA